MIEPLKRALKRLPPLRGLLAARDALAAERDALIQSQRILAGERETLMQQRDMLRERHAALTGERDMLLQWAGPEPRYVPPGHYYSPIASVADLRTDSARLFAPFPRELPGIDLNERGQLALLSLLEPYYRDLPFGAGPIGELRYGMENPGYAWSDGIFLYAMIRHLAPKRIVEVGSGNSSCLMLDVNELHFGGRLRCTFIEPEPARFLSLIRDSDRAAIDVIAKRLQDVPLSHFTTLEANDILFVDSSHVSKAGSDVNHLFAEILPRLRPGVHVHFHDVFYPFEYPREWLYQGKAFNEAYVLRAFLSFNAAFEIVLFNTFLEHFHAPRFAERMPLCLRNVGGSIWLRRR
jgi:predicted O-methyltransferase YrrM